MRLCDGARCPRSRFLNSRASRHPERHREGDDGDRATVPLGKGRPAQSGTHNRAQCPPSRKKSQTHKCATPVPRTTQHTVSLESTPSTVHSTSARDTRHRVCVGAATWPLRVCLHLPDHLPWCPLCAWTGPRRAARTTALSVTLRAKRVKHTSVQHLPHALLRCRRERLQGYGVYSA